MKTEISYGKKIRKLREERGWTQEQLAEATGVFTVRTIQRAENDETQGKETIQAIAGALDADLSALRTARMVPESRLLRAASVTTYRQFVDIEERYSSEVFGRVVMAPLTDEGLARVEGMLGRLFADRELIEPYEHSLWAGYLQQIEEPLRELFDLKLAFLVLDEQKDLLLPKSNGLEPLKPFIDDWRVRYFVVVPQHGCFRLSPADKLHRFNEECSEATAAVFRAVSSREIPGLHVYNNAMVAVGREELPNDSAHWCDCCFPILSNGCRLDYEYMERVTGLTRAELTTLWQKVSGDSSLHGLA
jgi:transcriptional regulator with XRE-family HTH domain